VASREIEGSVVTQIFERLARLEERVDALTHRVDDLTGEVRSLRHRVDTMLLAMIGLIATLAIKL
jgi:tetrahydromethanopterin S-methyltransferase subunit B